MKIYDTNKAKEFADKLQALLQEYNASIDWTCSDCSDLHGVYDEKMVISFGNKWAIEFPDGYINEQSFKE